MIIHDYYLLNINYNKTGWDEHYKTSATLIPTSLYVLHSVSQTRLWGLSYAGTIIIIPSVEEVPLRKRMLTQFNAILYFDLVCLIL